jgi:hypothetical protein
VPLLLCRFLPALPGLGAPVSPPIHRWGRYRADHLREGLRRALCGGLQGRALIMQEGLDGFPQVFDQMKPIYDLDSVGRAPANAIRIEGAPIAANDGHRGMLGQPVRNEVRGALRQEIKDVVILQVHQNGPVALPASPGPLIDPQHLWGRGRRHLSPLHQP